MSSPQMIRTFGLSLTGWPFAVEAPMPRTRAPADAGAYQAPTGILAPVSAAATDVLWSRRRLIREMLSNIWPQRRNRPAGGPSHETETRSGDVVTTLNRARRAPPGRARGRAHP